MIFSYIVVRTCNQEKISLIVVFKLSTSNKTSPSLCGVRSRSLSSSSSSGSKTKYLYVLDHLKKKKETHCNTVCIWLIPYNVIRVFVFPKKKKSGKFIVKYI